MGCGSSFISFVNPVNVFRPFTRNWSNNWFNPFYVIEAAKVETQRNIDTIRRPENVAAAIGLSVGDGVVTSSVIENLLKASENESSFLSSNYWDEVILAKSDTIQGYNADADQFWSGLGITHTTEWISNLDIGLSLLTSAAVHGDDNAQMTIAGVIIAVIVTIYGYPDALEYAGAAVYLAANTAWVASLGVGATALAVGVVVYAAILVAGTIYGILNIIKMLDDIAQIGYNLFKQYGQYFENGQLSGYYIAQMTRYIMDMAADSRDANNLATVTDNVSGMQGMWMAGGELYDSMKAGDIAFEVTGRQTNDKCVYGPNLNNSKYSSLDEGGIGRPMDNFVNNLAGSPFFVAGKQVRT